MTTESFMRPDERLSTFTSLLKAPSSSYRHLSLLDDNTLYGSVAYYLSGLEANHVGTFAATVAASGSFWATSPESATSTLLARSTNLSRAIAQATTRRVELLLKAQLGSIGWGTRRKLYNWVNSIIVASRLDVTVTTPHPPPAELEALRGQPIPRLSILTGLILGLNAVDEKRKATFGQVGLSIKACVRKVEDEWVVTLSECLELGATPYMPRPVQLTPSEQDAWEQEFRQRERDSSASLTDFTFRLPFWEPALVTAAHCVQYIPARKLAALPVQPLLHISTDAIVGLFEHHSVLRSLPADVTASDGQISLPQGSPTAKAASALLADPLFAWLGPISTIAASALTSAMTQLAPAELGQLVLTQSSDSAPANLRPFFPRIQILSHKMEMAWLSSHLAGAQEEQIESDSRERTKQLWTTFKSLIFSLTMTFDSLVEALIDMCPSPTETIAADPNRRSGITGEWSPVSSSNLPVPYVDIVQSVLQTYGHLYWIVNAFGTDGFTAYTRVLYSSLDILGRDAHACVKLMEMIEPTGSLGNKLEMNEAKRSGVTYYFDVAEQLTEALPDDLIERRLLPSCQPYLDDPQFRTTFESAHSFVLSIFSSQKQVSMELAPYYVQLLLKGFPSLLKPQQFEHAFTTIVNTVSDVDDAQAWWILLQLSEAIDQRRLALKASGRTDNALQPPSSDGTDAEQTLPPKEVLQVLETTYIAQLSNVNLTLMRSALARVRSYIKQATIEGDDGKRLALCDKTFGALALLDASTREEGLRWWTDHRTEFQV